MTSLKLRQKKALHTSKEMAYLRHRGTRNVFALFISAKDWHTVDAGPGVCSHFRVPVPIIPGRNYLRKGRSPLGAVSKDFRPS